ncbi:hypothetical protein J7444_07965 [Labrenzia sp. R4_1]|uniref:hypothetical protein n=1 Tax=Labrenzia sp. R4_1 TaxID=2821106 RepID=UPI001ADB17A0|nr:hypothetical protein [Labrenzia sp. R4_1]MBO9424652.1 hypothetical protein [Labrenzia sp. R4_1]
MTMTADGFIAQPSIHMARIRLTISQALIELEKAAQEADCADKHALARDIRAIGNNLERVAEMRLKPHGPISDVCGTSTAKANTPAGHPQSKGM